MQAGMLFLLKDKYFFKTHPRVTTKVYGYRYSETTFTTIGAYSAHYTCTYSFVILFDSSLIRLR